jgi:alkanesulfonate monooxygenase SsuD/methylene tetrahydromethanopterin reductase-like flavin-dependent oxidoreductase (luciferase family)
VKISLFTEIQCATEASAVDRLYQFLEQAELADTLGLRGFWIAEAHCQPRFSLLSAPYAVLGAASQRTRRLRLGVAVNTLPIHHPVQLAEQAATLDILTHGRMDFAAGGGHPHTGAYECFEVDHKKTREMMEESLRIIRAAWTEDVLTYDGQYFRIPGVVVNPKPLQKPHPPFYIAASSLDGVEFTARLNLNLFLPIHTRTREQLVNLSNSYWTSLERHGHDPIQRELGLLVPMHLAETTREAQKRAQDGIMSYYKIIGEMRSNYIQWVTRQGIDFPGRLSKTPIGEGLTFERVCTDHAVVGDSDTALTTLKQLADQTGAVHILVWMNIGSVPNRFVLESMRQFANDVMPCLETYYPDRRQKKGVSGHSQ